MNQHEENLQYAKDLVDWWSHPQRAFTEARPRLHYWRSADGVDSDTVMGWSGGAYDDDWYRAIHEAIGDACVSDREAWMWQASVMARVFHEFFTPTNRLPAFLNLVSITPSRVPRRLWRSQGRPTLDERLRLLPRLQTHAQPIRLALADPMALSVAGLLWAERPGARRKDLKIAVAKADRWFEGKRSLYFRFFEVDLESDAEALMANSVPAVADTLVGEGDHMRTHAPMIQLWKLYSSGMADLINLEASRDSGRMADIRCTSQRFADLVTHDPHYGPAFLGLERGDARPLFR